MEKLMAKRTFYCHSCSKHYQRLIDLVNGEVPEVACKVCKTVMVLQFATASGNVKEIIDNGIMPRRVERFDNADELYKEREQNARIKKHTDEL
jgi:hypothetical protein